MTTIGSRAIAMNRRRFLRVVAGGAASAGATCATAVRIARAMGGAAGLTGAAGFAATSANDARAQTAPAPLTIGVLRAPASGIISVTQQNGWFKQAGVELKEELFAAAAGPKIIQALGGGAIGLSFVNSTAALLGLAGGAIPLRFISIPTDPSRNFCILSAADIDSMAKLAGKKVAAPAGTALHYYLARALAHSGMAMKDVELVNLPAADAQAAFVAGRVDALVPTVNGRYYVLNAKKDSREVFAYDDFTKGPGKPEVFLNYDLFVTTQEVIDKNRAGLKAFLAAYHDKGVVYLLDPKTRDAATRAITDYVNVEQKVPTDIAIMNQILTTSRFYDAKTTKALMTKDDFRASLETQVKFFMDLKQMQSAPDLSKAVVTDLL
jgi:ABC-type nitrate/sulfonate/bicarbonate transport system substrate-binding protein